VTNGESRHPIEDEIMETMEIHKKFSFEAAHRLPNAPPGHICERLHGHSFEIEIRIRGPVDEARGWVADFAEIDQAFTPVHETLDHHYLNEVEGLENPTSENLARWLWQRLRPSLPGLCRVEVSETCNTGCTYNGPVPG
jgi:6-pyruvoyltetrahydropterin/6-carboxytetrahydropterin synthase